MSARDPLPPGPHDRELGDQDRCVVEGRTLDGDRCTVILIRDRDGIVLYPHGAAGMAVALPGEAVTKVEKFLTGRAS